ncbi:hypothetical protein ACEI30_004515 [Vibrio parahaemolyticus]
MEEQIKNDEHCWCGSGKLYIDCHLARHDEKPFELWETDKALRAASGKKYCSCPEAMQTDCKGKIINAHTVSKSGSLAKIAKDSHVYGFVPSVMKLDKTKGVFEPEPIGINKASTFTGFCGYHDKSLFSCFEDSPYVQTDEQNFLICYRSIAREFHAKQGQSEITELFKEADRGKSIDEQFQTQAFAFQHALMTQVGLRDTTTHKIAYDKCLLSKDYSTFNSYVIVFNEILPVQCSGSFTPDVDFNGNKLQDLMDLEKTLDLISCSIFSDNGKTYALFGWLNDSHDSCEKFIKSFDSLEAPVKAKALINFAFYTFENIYISPTWWDSRVFKFKRHLKKIINPYENIDVDYQEGLQHDFGEYTIFSKTEFP